MQSTRPTELADRPAGDVGPGPTEGVDGGPHEAYRRAEERHGSILSVVRREVRRVERGRLVSFLVAATVGLLYAELPIGPGWSLALAAVSAVVFVALVVRHRRLRRIVRRSEVAEALARLGQLRLYRQWQQIAEEHEALGYVDPLLDRMLERDGAHAYLEDLDVFGEASLRALLGPTPTPTGVATLRAWLRAPAAPTEVERRQRIVRALAPDFDGREALATEALLVGPVGERAWGQFLEWLERPALFDGAGKAALPPWAIWVARLLPPVTLTLLALDVVVGLGVPGWAWGIPLGVQVTMVWRWTRALHPYFAAASDGSRGLRRYHALFAAWEGYDGRDGPLRDLQARLDGGRGVPASEETRRLERWLDAADSRASMLHVIVAWGLLWDVHVAWGLEAWRRGAGSRVRDWFEALGELEALAALATLAHDHPSWTWPELHEGEPGLEATGLGHPLLPESVLKTSDVTVEGPGRFLLVTGSNMSGKSTMLRSIGLASVMAQAGSVVCARHLRLTPLRTFTSMRIQDSLTAGVSLFMAELNRLKALVDEADAGSADGPALLYLIDEVLQGTNSEERRIAARRIVAHLLDARAIGAVTTHDLSLHEDDRLERASTKVHFREHVGGGGGAAVLTFDYKLRPGLASSRNALKLLEIVGLGDGRAVIEGGG